MPRPRLTETGLDADLRIRMSREQRAAIDARAKSLGKPTSTHARDLLLADAAQVEQPAKKADIRQQPPK